MPKELDPIVPGMGDDLNRQITEAVLARNPDDRIQGGLSVLERVMMSRIDASSPSINPDTDVVELEADDLFDLISTVMELDDPAARRIGLTGLTAAFEAKDFDAFRINCLAIQRFCLWARQPNTVAH